ncbi:hypothetical protein F3I56_12940 [Pantoea sp. VH_25]|nr:hypothetical protein F3I56_12940 [Pantoea sp. VH_25]
MLCILSRLTFTFADPVIEPKVDAGRNLTLTSEQDSNRYDSRQQSAGAGGSFTFGSPFSCVCSPTVTSKPP